MSQAKPSAVGKSRRGIDAPTPAGVEDCRSRGRPEGDRGEWKASASSGVSRPCCKKSHLGDRRADSGANVGAAAPRGVVLSFEAKESTKESQRHGDYGKKPFITHFDGGARNVARNGVGQLSPALGARSCSPFSAVKMGGPFSLRCLSPLCSPAVGTRQTQLMRVGMLRRRLDGFAVSINRPVSQLTVGGGLT